MNSRNGIDFCVLLYFDEPSIAISVCMFWNRHYVHVMSHASGNSRHETSFMCQDLIKVQYDATQNVFVLQTLAD